GEQHQAVLGLGDRRLFVDDHPGPAVLGDPNHLHGGTTPHMDRAERGRLADGVGLDAVGAAPVEPYEATERHIRDRRERGLFADMRFTMARPEESCHPETLLAGARTVVSAALCYWAEGEEPPPGHGRLPRYTWWDAYSS